MSGGGGGGTKNKTKITDMQWSTIEIFFALELDPHSSWKTNHKKQQKY